MNYSRKINNHSKLSLSKADQEQSQFVDEFKKIKTNRIPNKKMKFWRYAESLLNGREAILFAFRGDIFPMRSIDTNVHKNN